MFVLATCAGGTSVFTRRFRSATHSLKRNFLLLQRFGSRHGHCFSRCIHFVHFLEHFLPEVIAIASKATGYDRFQCSLFALVFR